MNDYECTKCDIPIVKEETDWVEGNPFCLKCGNEEKEKLEIHDICDCGNKFENELSEELGFCEECR